MRSLLLLILLALLYWWASRALKERAARRKRTGARGWFRREREPAPSERMLACARCGLHLPESEGLHDHDGFYCCEEHRRLGVKR